MSYIKYLIFYDLLKLIKAQITIALKSSKYLKHD